ncbi:succinate semialdehyde dehydrogenase [Streptomyces sp. WMMB 322]|nr:succinate semialdehyde dehydrogenase [Streptomyces sp. WMMB 322]
MLIDGEWRPDGSPHPVTDPADGGVVGEVSFGTTADADAAADSAARAFGEWSESPARYRADILLAAAARIRERSAGLSVLLAREAGKRLPEARAEVNASAEYFRWFAEEARRPGGAVIPHEAPGKRHFTLRRPAGVVASLTPWNFPCSIQARKLAPALAAGCTVVARVSEKAPLAVTEMIRCLTDAGVPRGVVNVVHGPAAGLTSALLAHPAVRIVSFTGSTEVGRLVMEQASRRIVRPLLELGGDGAFVVLDDADVEAAVEGALIAKFRNTGQSCIAANRFIVQDGVYDEFTGRLAERVDAMSIGSGTAEPVPDLGPVIDRTRVDAVTHLVGEALAAGARRLTRERELPAAGHWLAPVLLADVPAAAGLGCREVFGPAAAVFRVSDDAEALRLANATEMGLAAYVWTRDVGRAWRFAEALETGVVGVNDALPSASFAPMGGVKQSGLGREGADVGLEEFTDVRYLALGM